MTEGAHEMIYTRATQCTHEDELEGGCLMPWSCEVSRRSAVVRPLILCSVWRPPGSIRDGCEQQAELRVREPTGVCV